MSKKSKGNNAFYYFMLDWRQQQSDHGTQMSLKDVAADPRCNNAWKNLAPQQKEFYKAQAKDSKISAQGSCSKKTALGEKMSEIESQEKMAQEFEYNMHQYIESVVSMGMRHKNLTEFKFIFVHVNWFFRREIGINKYEFCPAEFAVAEFSLENGIENIYHEILKVKIPLGWKRDAIETSQQTHRIPPELEDGQSDYSLMYEKFVRMLEMNKTGDKYPPLFTTKDLTLAVESLIVKMTDAAHESPEDFQVYSIEALFGALRNAAAQNVNDCSIPLVVAELVFAKDMFSSSHGIECEFHKNIDGTSQYCSKSAVRRWGFTICDYCCEYLKIPMTDGVHRPHVPNLDDHQNSGTNIGNINCHLSNLEIRPPQIVEMSGVSAGYRLKVSERSYEEEQKRRNDSKPVKITDHSTFNEFKPKVTPIVPSRPLRLPHTKPQSPFAIAETVAFTSDDFPPIGGRGTHTKKATNVKPPFGRGRGCC